MPKIQTTRVFAEINNALGQGFTTISEQGSSRSSKTYNTTIFLSIYAIQRPETTISIVRATRPAIVGSVLRDFKEIMINLGVWDSRSFNKTELIYHFDNGSWIEFFSCDDEQKLRGRKRQILYVNEANELKFIEWQQLQMRTTLFSILDYNPSFSDDHWICGLNQEKGTYHFITTYKDNPFLEQKVIDEIESLKEKNPTLWQVYGLGLQAIVEGLIFKKYEIIDEVPIYHKKHRYRGMDFGFTNDPTAIVDVYIADDILYLDEVCYKTEMLTSDIIRELKEDNMACGDNVETISESADPRMIEEIYNAGIDIKPVRKYGGSVKEGITKMQEFKLVVTRHSTNIVKELKNYTYRQDKNGKWLNEPIDAFNHCFVADTKVITSKGEKCINELGVGDCVLTSKGYRRVTKVFDNGLKEVSDYTLKTKEREIKITCTDNHLIKTPNEWKRISELKKEDVVFVATQNKEDIHTSALIQIERTNRRVEQVYDIEVEDAHEFFANDVLVHNCIDAIRYVILEKVLGQNDESLTLDEIADIL